MTMRMEGGRGGSGGREGGGELLFVCLERQKKEKKLE